MTGYDGCVRLFLLALIFGVGAGLLARGSLRNVARMRFHHPILLAPLLAASVLVALDVPGILYIWLFGLGCFVLFAFRNSLAVPGLVAVGIGMLANLGVTAANSGMPYRPSAVVAAGAVSGGSADLVPRSGPLAHPATENDRVEFLSDVIAIAPLREVASVGDIVAALGIALSVFSSIAGPRGFHKPEVTALQRRVSEREQTRAAALARQTSGRRSDAPDLEADESVKESVVRDALDRRIQLMKSTGDPTVMLDLSRLRPTMDLTADGSAVVATPELETLSTLGTLGTLRADDPDFDLVAALAAVDAAAGAAELKILQADDDEKADEVARLVITRALRTVKLDDRVAERVMSQLP